jgi:hypothetical protein
MHDAEHDVRMKSSAMESSNPLLYSDVVLQNVLSYVCPGNHLFVALVSKRWKEIYGALVSQQLIADAVYSEVRCGPEMTLCSAAFASPSTVQLALASELSSSSEATQRAAGKYGDIATLAKAHALGLRYTKAAMKSAAQCNKLAEVQYLYLQSCPWPLNLLEEAASNGFLELLRWCYELGCPWGDASAATRYAAESGNVELMAWVLQQSGTQLSDDVMRTAAAKGYIDMCRYLYQQQCPWNASSTREAAIKGHANLLDWLINNGCPWYARELCTCAASGGSVEVLTYLQKQGLLTNTALLTELLDDAAWDNKLAAAKWSRAQGAEWPTRFIKWRPWSHEVLQWAKAAGCTTPI